MLNAVMNSGRSWSSTMKTRWCGVEAVVVAAGGLAVVGRWPASLTEAEAPISAATRRAAPMPIRAGRRDRDMRTSWESARCACCPERSDRIAWSARVSLVHRGLGTGCGEVLKAVDERLETVDERGGSVGNSCLRKIVETSSSKGVVRPFSTRVEISSRPPEREGGIGRKPRFRTVRRLTATAGDEAGGN